MKNRFNLMNIFWIFIAIIAIIVVASIAIGIIFSARYPVYGYRMMGGYPGMWYFGGIFMIIPLILFFLFIFWIVSAFSHNTVGGNYYDYSNKKDALDILDSRYAKGEISTEEYQKMKQEILKR